MRTLPPDRPGTSPAAPGEQAAGEPTAGAPEAAGQDGPGCPRPPAGRRPGTTPLPGIAPCPGTGPPLPAGPPPPAGPRPLPDPAAVRLCLIPDSAPPYDAGTAGSGPAAAHGSPHATGPDPAGVPGPRRPPVPPGPTGLPGSPAPGPDWPGRFAQALAETLAGSRSPRQLVPWTTQRARERIQRLGPELSAGQQPRVRRVLTFHPTADAMEMTVVVGFGQRVHALAVRLERADAERPGGPGAGRGAAPGRWLCTTVEAA
jgi:Family of unknown function (DUF6459)